MKYIAPDGHVIVSDPNGPVSYDCPQTGMIEGTFESIETTYCNNQFGIQQIHITRVVDVDSVLITIRESTDAKLQEYIDSIIRVEPQPEPIVPVVPIDNPIDPSLN
jgi:hypothetical protein